MARLKKNLAIIFLALQSLAFVFTIAGIPTAQIRAGARCYTLWGYKAACGSRAYTTTGAAAFGCLKRTNNMKSGAVGAVLGCALAFVAAIGGILMVAGLGTGTFLATSLSLLAFTALTLGWACTVEVQRTPGLCGAANLTGGDLTFWEVGRTATYAAGFCLLVVGWVMQVAAVCVLMVYLGVDVVHEEHALRAMLPAEEAAARRFAALSPKATPHDEEEVGHERHNYNTNEPHAEGGEEEGAVMVARRSEDGAFPSK